MAIQNDNTLVTKGDLKSLYTDKIAPYLGGGISYYYTDRTGEELKSIDMRLSAGQAVNAGSTQNTLINFDKSSGTYETNNHKVIIPAGQRIQINVALQASPGASNAVDGEWQIYDYTNDIIISKANFTYIGSGYSWSSAKSVQYTAPENGALVGVKVTALFYNTSVTASSSFTIQEIGRIVDPVKYVDNNSDLEETPVGNIISYMGNNVPKHYLACDGQTYPIGSYPELEAFIIDEFGSINYFGGDGSTTWAVPDLRGEFLRGTGTNSHTNQGSGANVGIHQDGTEVPNTFAYGSKWHGIYTLGTATDTFNAYPMKMDSTISGDGYIQNASAERITSQSTATKSYTTRPTNTSVKYCIKYESTFHAFFSNAAYKVSVAASVTASSAVQLIFDSSDIIGDSSLISGNSLVAPMDGWYSLGMNWSQSGSGDIGYYIRINGASGKGYNRGIFISDTLYLNKGDVITIWKESGSANSGRVNFCLLTSNYNPTIVSADSIYSENEQMIGYWTNGKPLYQKTINCGVLPNATIKYVAHNISNLDTVTNIKGIMCGANSTRPMPFTPTNTPTGAVDIGYQDSDVFISTGTNRSDYLGVITLQYTKTTDTASTLQVENSLLLNRPDLWEDGVEYHFGGGLYGKRIEVAQFSSASKIEKNVTIATGVSKIINYGGEVYNMTENWHQVVGTYRNSRTTADNDYSALYYIDNNSLVFWFSNDSTQTFNFSIDTWVTYKK